MDKVKSEAGKFQIRILFGPLFGSDIAITGDDILFCVGEQVSTGVERAVTESESEWTSQRSLNTLYIPYRNGQPNFRLRFIQREEAERRKLDGKKILHSDLEVDFLSENLSSTLPVKFNEVCRFGDIAFAIKRQQDEWSDAVANYIAYPVPDAAACLPPARNERAVLRFASQVGLLLVGGAALTALACWQIQRSLDTRKINSVSEVLAGAPTHNTILNGINDRIYVLSSTQDGADWDRSALMKSASSGRVEVASVGAERNRLQNCLEEANIDFVTIRLDSPASPELVVLDSTSPSARENAVRELRHAAPYVKTVRITATTNDLIQQDARAVLDKAETSYRVVDRSDGATFYVTNSLGDEQLALLRHLIHAFNQKWGKRRVNFKIALRTNWLKGKTYQEGGDGYVLLGHAFWYFP